MLASSKSLARNTPFIQTQVIDHEQDNKVKFTDRELLLYNPNYKILMDRMTQKTMFKSELGRILHEETAQPKRKEMALFHFVKTFGKEKKNEDIKH